MDQIRIVNIVDNAQTVNFGIWNSAIATAKHLQKYNILSELWFPAIKGFNEIDAVENVPLTSIQVNEIERLIECRDIDPKTTVFFTHGAWQFPTRWGAYLVKKGYKWVYSPHGMFEPWSMSQKRIKKVIYFKLIEQQLGKRAHAIRAVSKIELNNLEKQFSNENIVHIPNGVDVIEEPGEKKKDVINFLFLARLHYKKGIFPLVQAWIQSSLNNTEHYNLYIAGPDQGELTKIQPFINQSRNIQYIGAVYGDDKALLFQKCHFYVLPSHSEGFPTSVLEAMQYGLIPLISAGANFPEVHENGLALRAEPETEMLVSLFNKIKNEPYSNVASNARKCYKYVQAHYSLSNIADRQFKLIRQLIDR